MSFSPLSPTHSRRHQQSSNSEPNVGCCDGRKVNICTPVNLVANICIIAGTILFMCALVFFAAYLAPNAIPKMTQAVTALANSLGSDLFKLSLFSFVSSLGLSFLGTGIKGCLGSLS